MHPPSAIGVAPNPFTCQPNGMGSNGVTNCRMLHHLAAFPGRTPTAHASSPDQRLVMELAHVSVSGLWVDVRPARGDWLNDNRRMAKCQWASTAHFLPQTRESEEPNTPDQSSNADMTGAGVRAGPARPLVEAQGAKVALAACYRGCPARLKHLRLPPAPL